MVCTHTKQCTHCLTLPLYAWDQGTPRKRNHPATPQLTPKLPTGVHEPNRPLAPESGKPALLELQLEAFLSSRSSTQIADMLFPLIKEDADRLERFMGANLMSSEAEKKEKLTALVVEWKPTGFSTASTTTMVQPVCECLKKLSAIFLTKIRRREAPVSLIRCSRRMSN
jgi:hypothetical protein